MHSTSGCNGHQRPEQPEDRNSTSYNFRNSASGDLSLGFGMVSGTGKSLVQSVDSSISVAAPLRIFTSAEDETRRDDRGRRPLVCFGCHPLYGAAGVRRIPDNLMHDSTCCMVAVRIMGQEGKRHPVGYRVGDVSRSSDSL